MTNQASKAVRFGSLRTAAFIIAFALTGACMSNSQSADEQPPEREFDQSTAWERMEESAAEAIEGLPDFPGFEERILHKLDCTHNGEVDEEYVNLELSYRFSDEVSEDPLVRETYLGLLREQWQEAGYDIHRDMQMGDDPPHHALEARRQDGINYWYRVGNLVVLKIQSGCMKAVEDWSPECPEPLGGVTPENDQAAKRYCGTDDTTEEANAIAPFEGTQAAAPLGASPWSHAPGETAEPAADRYSNEL